MQKNHFVLTHMDRMLDALTRGLDLRSSAAAMAWKAAA